MDKLAIDSNPKVEAAAIEGVVMVNLAKLDKETTFQVYSDNIISPMVQKVARNCLRVDIIFDTYPKASLKSITRKKKREKNSKESGSNFKTSQ